MHLIGGDGFQQHACQNCIKELNNHGAKVTGVKLKIDKNSWYASNQQSILVVALLINNAIVHLAIKLNNSHHMLSTKPKLKTLTQVQLSKIIAKKLIKNGINKQT